MNKSLWLIYNFVIHYNQYVDRLNDYKYAARKRSVDWTSSASTHVDAMTSDVIAPSQWKIFGCKNGTGKYPLIAKV